MGYQAHVPACCRHLMMSQAPLPCLLSLLLAMKDMRIPEVVVATCGAIWDGSGAYCTAHAQAKTVTTNWKDQDDQKGKRAPGLDAVGTSAAPSEK